MIGVTTLTIIILVGIAVLLILIAVYLMSRRRSDRDSRKMLHHINDSLDEIIERVDSMEVLRKSGAATSGKEDPDEAHRGDVDDFLAQFGGKPAEEENVASESFDVSKQEELQGVSHDQLLGDLNRPAKKLDGHDRQTQASLKPREDRPMRLSRQTLAPQGEEQERMQEEIRKRTVHGTEPQVRIEIPAAASGMPRPSVPQKVARPAQPAPQQPVRPAPVNQQVFVQPQFTQASQPERPVEPAPQPVRPAVQPAPQPAQPAPQPVRPAVQPAPQPVQPAPQQPVQPVRPAPVNQQVFVQPQFTQASQPGRPAEPAPQPVRPAVQPAPQPVQPAPQQPVQPVRPAPVNQQGFVQPQFTQASQPERPAVQSASQPVQPTPQPAQPAPQQEESPSKFTDRESGRDKQGRVFSVEELMQQIK